MTILCFLQEVNKAEKLKRAVNCKKNLTSRPSSYYFCFAKADVAQLVEQRTRNA